MTYSFASYLPYYRRNLRLAFPVMLTQLGAALVGLFDSIMVGHYGTTDLAAVSFSNALFFTVMVFAMGALMAITPIVGYAVGANEGNERIASLLANALIYMLIVSVFACAILMPCIPMLHLFGQDPQVVHCARPYYTLIVLSILPFLFFCLCKQFLEGLGNTTVAMVITIACNLLNILLNWVLIFGFLATLLLYSFYFFLSLSFFRYLLVYCILHLIGTWLRICESRLSCLLEIFQSFW